MSCYEGFALKAPKCEPVAAVNIPNCDNITPAGQCTSCIQGYFVKNNKCEAVPITCETYNRANGVCTKCIGGHFLQNN